MDFLFPDLGEGIHEGKIVRWMVKEGDTVKKDQPVCEVETDKAVVDIPCPQAGKISKINFRETETVHVGKVLFVLDTGGEKSSAGEAEEKRPSETPSVAQSVSKPSAEKEIDTDQGIVGATSSDAEQLSIRREALSAPSSASGVRATPAVRRLARELGVELSGLSPSGSDGRVTEEDVRTASKGAGSAGEAKGKRPSGSPPSQSSLSAGEERVPLKGIRAAIAKNMMRSLQESAQVTHFDRADATALVELRKEQKAGAEKRGVKLTYLAYVVRAVSQLLPQHPSLNASLIGEELVFRKPCNIGLAVDTEHGLLVPNIKGAESKPLLEIAKEIEQLAQKARDRKLSPQEMQGGTFTITNVGAIGGVFFTPVINPPESAILALGKMQEEAVVRDGKIVARMTLPLSLTYDHRIVDGAPAARFLKALISLLEQPEKLS